MSTERRRRERAERLRLVALITGCAVVAALLAWGVIIRPAQERAAEQDALAAQIRAATPVQAPAEPDLALFFGDSYTVGVGATGGAPRWATLVTRNMGWVQENRGQTGTGYVREPAPDVCGKAECQRYAEVIAESADMDPAVVVIAGGQNDFALFGRDREAVGAEISATFDLLRETFPDARVIAVGPSTPDAVNSTVERFDAVVQESAARIGAEYVSLIDPDVISDEMVLGDKIHVGPEGHAAIAERVLSVAK